MSHVLTLAASAALIWPVMADSIVQFSSTSYPVTEGTPRVEIKIIRTADLDTVVSVDFANTTNGTATAGLDYREVSTNLTFQAGESAKLVAVAVLNDSLVEPGEYFLVTLSNPTGGATLGTPSIAIVRITDNDPGIQTELPNYWVAEDAGSVVIAVTRGAEETTPATVDFATADSTAKAGLDYTATSGTLNFAADETRKLVTIPLLNDSLKEPDKTFALNLRNPTGDLLGARRSAAVTIEDNDPGIQVEFDYYWAREDSGSVLIAVTRGPDENSPATVDFATSDGTALAGQDYTAMSGTLSFSREERVKLLTIPILDDGVKEVSKTFRLTISNPTGGALLGTTRVANVIIEDADPGVQFTLPYHGSFFLSTIDYWVHKIEGVLQVPVTRGNDRLLDPFTVEYAVIDMTATAGVDYALTNGVLEFGLGEMQKWITIPIVSDGLAERDEQFRLVLRNPTASMNLGRFTNATVTICDDTEMRPHRFDRISLLPEGQVSLTLGGGYTPGLGLSNRFQPYFDIYPLEVSTNLVSWTSLGWLIRTNATATNVTFVDRENGQASQRFYRTPTNNLITPSLVPTGPYAVGKVDRLIQNPEWRNIFRISTNGNFMVTVWYPAQRTAGQVPAPYDFMPRNPYWWVPEADLAVWFRGYGASNAPFNLKAGPCPVVMLSGGWKAYRDQMKDKCAELASQGYVVVDLDQFDYSVGIFPEGYCFLFDFAETTGRAKSAVNLKRRVRELRRTVEELEGWNRNDVFFAGKLDLNRMAAMGLSWGAEAAFELCRLEPRCRAAINLDDYAFSLPPRDRAKPTLTINRFTAGDVNSDTSFFDTTFAPAIWFQVSDTVHLDFEDFCWFESTGLPNPPRLAHRREATQTQIVYMLWFLDKYVKGIEAPMPSLAEHPRVINFKQK